MKKFVCITLMTIGLSFGQHDTGQSKATEKKEKNLFNHHCEKRCLYLRDLLRDFKHMHSKCIMGGFGILRSVEEVEFYLDIDNGDICKDICADFKKGRYTVE